MAYPLVSWFLWKNYWISGIPIQAWWWVCETCSHMILQTTVAKMRKKASLFYFTLFYFWPYHVACKILVPWPGIEPMPPAVETWSLNHWTAREVPEGIFKNWNSNNNNNIFLNLKTTSEKFFFVFNLPCFPKIAFFLLVTKLRN